VQVHVFSSRAGGQASGRPAREYVLETRRLTIGRDSFQDLQLPDPQVEPRHAIIRPDAGRLRIERCTRQRIRVNGVWRSVATLSEGDSVQIGATTIIVRRARRDASVQLEVESPEAQEAELSAQHALSLRATRLSAQLWSWMLVLGIIAVFLVPALSAALYAPARPILRSNGLLPSDRLWQTGPLHPSHRSIGGNCNACHLTPFRRVGNAQCTTCHKNVQHHVDVRTSDVALFGQQRCGDCHVEHERPSILIQRDSRLCTDCHAHLKQLKGNTELVNVADFGADHPDFRPTMLERSSSSTPPQWHPVRSPRGVRAEEHSNLIFSHAEHLKPKGIKSPTGYEVMKCQDCHQPNTGGRQMLSIRMEAHCSRCHSLLFDEHDPSTAVPHGDLKRVFETLQGHFIRTYLDSPSPPDQRTSSGARRPGAEAEIMTREQQRRARDWADRQSLLIARELLEKRVCVECHRVTRVPGATGFNQWQVEPVRITQDWMPLARFSHASHATTACTTCHAKAAGSKTSTDVLMPSIAVCRQCHGGAADTGKLASDCGMCHTFHLPGRGSFDAGLQHAQRWR
jgi:pSer/pThr/pTyr-binding forkhead associated (FHA) protein